MSFHDTILFALCMAPAATLGFLAALYHDFNKEI
jgi:hypothetical protein